ncbi:DMT family transporter [Opitutaceae bacterium]
MTFPVHLLFPLGSSVGYVVAVLLVKRSADYGLGLWRTTFVSNLTMGVCLIPLWLLGGAGQPVAMLWQPAVAGALFFLGQACTFWAMAGDVSVATPVLGLKIIMVAIGSALLLSDPVPLKWWIAAALSTLAIALLNAPGRRDHQRVSTTVLAAALAAAFYALSDVLVQKWTPAWGAGRFIPLMFGAVAIYSFALIPLFRAPLSAIPAAGWRWLGPGALALAAQSASMAYVLGVYGDATAVNIVYSSRGLWSVVAVWLIGHWFSNTEGKAGPVVMRRRLAGALLMLAAIGLVVI